MGHDWADLNGVPAKALKKAVRRNIGRFPSDFMVEPTHQEFIHLRPQIVTSSVPQRGEVRYKPMYFTEQGVAIFSSVLRSKQAVHLNIEIMRAFARLRQMLSANKEFERKLADNILTAKRADPNAQQPLRKQK